CRQRIAAGVTPFWLMVVTLYPFAATAERHRITFDDLVEEMDSGRPADVRADTRNSSSVPILKATARKATAVAANRDDGHVASARRCGRPGTQRSPGTRFRRSAGSSH